MSLPFSPPVIEETRSKVFNLRLTPTERAAIDWLVENTPGIKSAHSLILDVVRRDVADRIEQMTGTRPWQD